MAILKCKMCGGDIELSADKTFGTCDYCGCTNTFPKIDDEQRAVAFNRGNHFRRIGEFDKALAVYERIVMEDNTDAEAHWCCALCRFGIEYVEDPTTYEWVPTCHRASFDSILEDVDYLAAVEYSDGVTQRQYQKEANKIAEIQRGILATSQNEEPFDVFICYKESDENGDRTVDSTLAQDIYYQLNDKGYRTFFARITLEDLVGAQYEPYIFAALNSAKVMIVVGTKAEYLNAVWVKNEWSRYLALMKKDKSKVILPCFRDMDPYDMPEALSVLQSYDMSKIGFIQDLLRGVEKIVSKDAEGVTKKVEVVHQESDVRGIALIKRGYMALEDEEWEKAEGYFDEALNIDAENYEAYLGVFLAKNKKLNLDEIIEMFMYSFKDKKAFSKTIQESPRVNETIEKFSIPDCFTSSDIKNCFVYDLSYQSYVDDTRKYEETAKSYLAKDKTWKKALQFSPEDRKIELIEVENKIIAHIEEQTRLAELHETETKESKIAEYNAFVDEKCLEVEEKYSKLIEKRAEEKRKFEEIRLSDYKSACEIMDNAKKSEEYRDAAEIFRELGDYEDCRARAVECEQQYNRLVEEQRRREELAAQEEKRIYREKVKKRIILGICFAAVIVALVLVMTKVILPNMERKNTYEKAIEKYNAQSYEEAIEIFEGIGDYKDSKTYTKMSKYELANILKQEEKYIEAARLFTELGEYEDSGELLKECKQAISAAEEEQKRLEAEEAAREAEEAARIERENAIANFSYYNETYNYFIEHKQEYTKLSGSEIEDIIVGTWNRQYAYAGTIGACVYVIYSDGTCKELNTNYEMISNWEITGDVYQQGVKTYFDKYDVYDIGDGYYMLYENGTSEPKILMWK